MPTKVPANAFKSEEEAKRILEELKRFKYAIVEKVEKKRKSEPPPPLHSLTSLQREANKLFGFSAQKTLSIAQRLYEERKIISYPRTDSQYLAESNKPLVKEILKTLGKEELVPKVEKVGKRVFNDAKLTDHHAIIPLAPPPEDLTKDERRIYDLIWRKFVGAFMDNYDYEITKVLLRVGKYLFGTTGKRDIRLGWKALYKETEEENKLPQLRKGDKVAVERFTLKKEKTTPPPRYTEGKLLKVMEKLGLGTPATRASILETLKQRGYVEVKGKQLAVSKKAKELFKLLEGSKVASPEMTAEWERALESIYLKRRGKAGYEKFLEGIKRFTAKEVETIKNSTLTLSAPRLATPKMLAYAKDLAKKLGMKPPKTKDFDEVKRFIDGALEKLKNGVVKKVEKTKPKRAFRRRRKRH